MRVGRRSFEQTIATAETGSGMSLSMIPPCMVLPRGLVWRLAMLTPSTMTFLGDGVAPHDLAGLAAVLAGEHLHAVTLADPHHITSGASETIRMNRLSRSSRPTGPKMRVPRGCCCSLMRTAAFSSKRM